MGKKLYVGNLPYGTSDNDLQSLFLPHGTVQSAQVVMLLPCPHPDHDLQ